ncbi:methionyl-tRNA formyltransferase [Desulfoglaeba alkanexedens]|uniref:Methionyl-tRNA formyltransferase n=1 Tax=Desulfoglaeba alkanexedens ALDC TaxID=980445 RepID=A0A4P8L5B2_9BACT|nr:methionyl-tRNA formyltransferase [Desulfoglaeba alkanexedens]QCQ22255.1 methionyl-tRNA formyltransferase [Desulfoglaeba alkanexedens ALDC]
MEKEIEGGTGLNPSLPRLLFLGTPDFACPYLEKLVEAGAPVPLVVTQPDRPRGRGKIPTPPPVKVLAETLGLKVYQPEKIRSPEVVAYLTSFGADCLVLVAYGQLLPKRLLDAFPLGAVNAHPSLLPRHRGAAPIQRTLLAGETVTGVSIMLMDAGMDTGPVLARKKVPIGDTETFGSLHDRLAQVGAELLVETLAAWHAKKIQPEPQDNRLATAAPPIHKDELIIAWQDPASAIVNRIRAFDPWPGAVTRHAGKRLKCFSAGLLPWKSEGRAGEVLGATEAGLVVLAGDGQALTIGDLQLEGKRVLEAGAFLRGYPIPRGSRLE